MPYTQSSPPGTLHSATSYDIRGTSQHSRVDSPRQTTTSLPPPLYLPLSSVPSQGSSGQPTGAPSGSQIYSPQPPLYSVSYPTRSQNFSNSDTMAVHPVINRQMYPTIGAYHPSQTASTHMHSSHHDLQARGMYTHGFGYPQQQHMFAYPQYALPTHPAYATHPSSQTYSPVSPAGSAILMPQQTTSALHSSPSHGITASPRMKVEPSHLKFEHQPMKSEQNYVQRPISSIDMAQSGPVAISSPPSGAGSNTAAPGPIPATTPLVVRQDQNGVQWIAFEYSRDRVKMEYQIRCDVESVVIDELTPEFKTANCVYPGAYSGKEGYKGNRLHYESECNAVGWALAHLNPALREKRGLIQRAVDSWRNSNQDPRLRSRRVRRQAKINNRKAQLRQPDGPISLSPADSLASRAPPVMSMDSGRPPAPPLNLNAGQMHHHHSTSDGNGGESVSNEALSSLDHRSPSLSLIFDRPLASPLGPHRRDSHCPNVSSSFSTGSDSSTADTRNYVKAEENGEKLPLFGDEPEAKRRKFILVDDPLRGTRVRVHVELDNIKLDEMPDFHLQKNSVFPRQFYPRQMNSISSSPESSKDRHISVHTKTEGERITLEGEDSVNVPLLDGSQLELPIPRISEHLRLKECALNELGYRMSWRHAKTFNERTIFMQRSRKWIPFLSTYECLTIT
ncbi:hypothetical protein AUEXF2481DRAFT_83533 [Aureobasidium subglaciale EXF-2481]|uniref:DUF8032 domain-containing protein n=1 Tax=Aureobasidium subglaciale (strain EXF-2481) TaxID=1043005 RepID=A0A074Y508_AURSE|nr:uncharacterized protein AUEXF2481DRAFT_83533 [Aureobasidium subglaciale EXF-2481]KEQ91029.1 hypothetical protein AUEXF2481DRAFT_83533 [Aureobasidium subglaciale EXF-2481]